MSEYIEENKRLVIEAWKQLREINNSLPDEILDLMKDLPLAYLNGNRDSCRVCRGAGRLYHPVKANFSIECTRCAGSGINGYSQQISSLSAENKKLKEALSVYADESNWDNCNGMGEFKKHLYGIGNGFSLAQETLREIQAFGE